MDAGGAHAAGQYQGGRYQLIRVWVTWRGWSNLAPFFMAKRLLDYDPIRGVSCYMEYQASTDSVTMTHEQDVAAVLDANKRQAADEDKTRRGIKNDWWKYASVPAIVEVEWLNKYGVILDNPEHKQRVFELLNHPDYKYLKTTNKVHVVKSD